MSDGNDSSCILLEVLLKPVDGFGIEVVGRLIKQQHIGLLQEKSAKCHTTTLTTREVLYRPFRRWTMEGIHCTVELGVNVPSIGGVDDVLQFSLTIHQFLHLVWVFVVLRQTKLVVDFVIFLEGVVDVLHTFHDVFLDGLFLVEWRVLWQVTNGVARCPYHLSLILLVNASDDFHQGGLTSTIQTHDTNLGSVEEG